MHTQPHLLLPQVPNMDTSREALLAVLGSEARLGESV